MNVIRNLFKYQRIDSKKAISVRCKASGVRHQVPSARRLFRVLGFIIQNFPVNLML